MNLSTTLSTEQDILRKILKRVDPRKVGAFQEQYNKLKRNKTLIARKNILYLLYKIHESSLISVLPLEIPKPLINSPKKINLQNPLQKIHISKLEKELLQDLVYILQGSDGRYIKYSNLEDKYTIQTNYLFFPLAKMLDEITELACLHKRVQKFLVCEHLCLASQSLSCCIQNELSEYYRLITLFQNDADISLRKIYLWISQPVERLKWIALITEATETLRGSEIVSALHSYLEIGDAGVRSLLYKLLESASVSMMNMIETWITDGEIRDPFHEFFIGENPKIEESLLWENKFSIINEQVPNFFTKDIVDSILLAGKTINFIRISCKKEWSSYLKCTRPQIYELEKFKTWISNASSLANKSLFEILFANYKLGTHCMNIKKFHLLGQGDFHHSLMEQLAEILKNKAKVLHKHNLRSILDNAIRNSNLQLESQEFLYLLDIKLLDETVLDLGWDVFTLDYTVNSPLTVIFTPPVMETYRKLFKYLWHVKRAMFSLGQFQCIRTLITYQNNKELYCIIQKFMILRQSMRHFINNLMSYLILEVIENAWKRFYTRLFLSADLDEIIFIHKKFLTTLLEEMLISNKEIFVKIMKLLELCIMSENLWQDLLEIVMEQKPIKYKAVEPISLEQKQKLDEYDSDIKIISEEFDKELKFFMNSLLESGDSQQKFLAFRIDFNEYYQFQDFFH